MKRLAVVLLAVAALMVALWGSCMSVVYAAGASAASLTYIVTIQPGAPKVSVAATAEGLKGGTTTLALRSEATYVETYISDFTAGTASPQKIGAGRWTAKASGGVLKYQYNIANVVPWHPNVPWGTSSDIGIYVDGQCALFMAPYLFVFPDQQEFTSIRVKFVVPSNWRVVTPFAFDGEFYVAEKVTRSLLDDFLNRQQIYMGPMRFYAEQAAGECTVKLGQLVADQNKRDIRTAIDVSTYVNATVQAVNACTKLFGANPYKAFAMYTNFRHGKWSYQGGRYGGNGCQFWPVHRWDELVGHVGHAWANTRGAPLLVEPGLAKGIVENYYGQLLAWQLLQDEVYLAKMYRNFLMYEWMYNHHNRQASSYTSNCDEYDAYFRWEFIALLLDQEIQKASSGTKTLADAIALLYSKYSNSGRVIGASDLESAVKTATGISLSAVFSKYVYGHEKLPVYSYLALYKPYFDRFVPMFEQTRFHTYLCGHVIPLFVDIVLSASLGQHLPWALNGEGHAVAFAQEVLKRYKLETLTEGNVTSVLSEITGQNCSDFFVHWQDTYGRLTLEQVVAWLKQCGAGGS